MEIRITRTTSSRIDAVDYSNLAFGRTFTDHMFVMEYDGSSWRDARIEPLAPFETHPANIALHYGQAIFEGMKVSVDADGNPLLFRPEMHARRLNASAERMCMPTIEEEFFIEALSAQVLLEKDWIPKNPGSALYIRPMMYATDCFLGVQPSQTFRFVILTLPVGAYYDKPVSLLASDTYVRAAEGGVGEAKTAGNYAASLLPSQEAKAQGFDQVLWLDGKEFKYVQEVGTMNLFFVFENEIVTPDLSGAILRGITRDSFIRILRTQGRRVSERLLSIDEVFEAHGKGHLKEVFGAGTAAVASTVERIAHQGRELHLDPSKNPVATYLKGHINGLRNGTVPDEYGWVRPAMETVAG